MLYILKKNQLNYKLINNIYKKKIKDNNKIKLQNSYFDLISFCRMSDYLNFNFFFFNNNTIYYNNYKTLVYFIIYVLNLKNNYQYFIKYNNGGVLSNNLNTSIKVIYKNINNVFFYNLIKLLINKKKNIKTLVINFKKQKHNIKFNNTILFKKLITSLILWLY